jgi:protocatechuate 3,4-dioxygenase beta subunit
MRKTAVALSIAMIAVAIALWFAFGSDPENPSLTGTSPISTKDGGQIEGVDVDGELAVGDSAAAVDAAPGSEATSLVPRARAGRPLLSGRILDRRGEPVVGARVVALSSAVLLEISRAGEGRDSNGNPFERILSQRERVRERLGNPQNATSDSDGRYEIDELDSGEYRLLVSHLAFVPSTETFVSIPSPRNVEPIEGASTDDAADAAAAVVTRDVTLRDGVLLRGRVRTKDGTPVAGAVVTLRRSDQREVKGLGRLLELAEAIGTGAEIISSGPATTNSDGEFEIGSLEPAIWDLRASHAEFLTGVVENVAPGSEPELRLVPAPRVRGRVVSAAGLPVPEAAVLLRAPRPRVDPGDVLLLLGSDMDLLEERTRKTTCSGDGRFEIHVPAAGAYEFVVSANGRQSVPRVEELGEKDIDIGDLLLDSGRSLNGRVSSSRGIAIAGARVRIVRRQANAEQETGADPIAFTTTDAAGGFTLVGLPDGELAAHAIDDREGHGRAVLEESDTQEVEIRLAVGVVVEGRILSKSRRNPIAGAVVALSTGPARSVISDEQGLFRFENVDRESIRAADSRVFLVVGHESYRTQSANLKWTEDVPLEIVLEREQRVRGIVVDSSGLPVPGARVAAEVPGMPTSTLILFQQDAVLGSFGAFADSDGRFELSGGLWDPGGGVFDVVASHPAHGRGRARAERPPDDPSSDQGGGGSAAEEPPAHEVLVVLRPGSSVEGVVRAESGEPVRLARVAIERSKELSGVGELFEQVLPGATAMTVLSDENGRFVFEDVESGTQRIDVTANGFAKYRREDVEVGSGTTSIDIVLERGESIAGRVLDRASVPVPGVDVLAFPISGDDSDAAATDSYAGEGGREINVLVELAGRGLSSDSTDSDGRFEITDLPLGRYHIVARGRGIVPAARSPVEPGKRLEDLIVDRYASLAIVVRDEFDASPIGWYDVSLEPQSDIPNMRGRSQHVENLRGRFEAESLAPGKWTLNVKAPGYCAWSAKLRFEGGEHREIEAWLSLTRVVSGRVVSSLDGAPLRGVQVQALRSLEAVSGRGDKEEIGAEQVSSVVETDSEGRFELSDAIEGACRVVASHPDYYDARMGSTAAGVQILDGSAAIELPPIELSPGSVIRVELSSWTPTEPDRGSSAHLSAMLVSVRDDESSPDSDVGRRQKRSPSALIGFEASADLDRQGRARLRGLPAGTYEIRLVEEWTEGGGAMRREQRESTLLGEIEVRARESVDFQVGVEAR